MKLPASSKMQKCKNAKRLRLRRKIQKLKYSKMQKGAYNRNVLIFLSLHLCIFEYC